MQRPGYTNRRGYEVLNQAAKVPATPALATSYQQELPLDDDIIVFK